MIAFVSGRYRLRPAPISERETERGESMRRILFALGSVVLMLAVSGSIAAAGKPGAGTCSGGAPGSPEVVPAGTYEGFTVSGNCVFGAGTMVINGKLTIADGGVLNDHASGLATVHITGNVVVGRGAVLGLGNYNPVPPHTSAIVDGNITAHKPLTLYLGGMTVHGSVVSTGGGDPGRNFPIKDDTIDGNLILQGWSGLWLGVIRDTVGGNVIVANTAGTQTGLEEFEGILDSTEVVSNVISGNLICHGNSPAAQIGDAALEGGGANTVGGQAIGECAGLTG
jgi:hypothetical protein